MRAATPKNCQVWEKSNIHNVLTEFKVREKIFPFSGDSFEIKDRYGKTAFKVSGKLLTLRERKTLLDADGSTLYAMTENIVSLHNRMHILDKTGNVIMTIRRKHIIPMFKGTVQVWNGVKDNGQPVYEIVGSIIRKNFEILDRHNGRVAATICRKWMKFQNILEKDVYIVTVNPGYNSALMVFLAVAVDEQFHDD